MATGRDQTVNSGRPSRVTLVNCSIVETTLKCLPERSNSKYNQTKGDALNLTRSPEKPFLG